ncbi:hypothetical protein QA597_07440 [Marinilabiliaceae bacterium ANBcel2]|nr:hypothetical protein [Marinilabiliaceae bacterium ANBcel2]
MMGNYQVRFLGDKGGAIRLRYPTKKANAQIGTFGFCRPISQTQKKPKDPIFLPTLGQTNNETNEMYIEKRDKRKIWTILAT